MKEKNQKSWKSCEIYYIHIVDVTTKTNKKNGLKTIDNNEILWLNEEHTGES